MKLKFKKLIAYYLCIAQILMPSLSWAHFGDEEDINHLRRSQTYKARISHLSSPDSFQEIECHEITPNVSGHYRLAFDSSLHEEESVFYLTHQEKLVGEVSFSNSQLNFLGFENYSFSLENNPNDAVNTNKYIYPKFSALVSGDLLLKGGEFSEQAWVKAKNISFDGAFSALSSFALQGEEKVTLNGQINSPLFSLKTKYFINNSRINAKDIHLDVEKGKNNKDGDLQAEQDLIISDFENFEHKGKLRVERFFLTDGTCFKSFPGSQSLVGVMHLAKGEEYFGGGRWVAGSSFIQTRGANLKKDYRFEGRYLLGGVQSECVVDKGANITAFSAAHLQSNNSLCFEGQIYLVSPGRGSFPYIDFTLPDTSGKILAPAVKQTAIRIQKLQQKYLPNVDNLHGVLLQAKGNLIHKGKVEAPSDSLTYKGNNLIFSGDSQSGSFEGIKTLISATQATCSGILKAPSGLLCKVSEELKLLGSVIANQTQIFSPLVNIESTIIGDLFIDGNQKINSPTNRTTKATLKGRVEGSVTLRDISTIHSFMNVSKDYRVIAFTDAMIKGVVGRDLLAQNGEHLNTGAHVGESVIADNVNDVSSTATIGENLQVSNFEQAVLNGTIEGNIIAQMGHQLNTGAYVGESVIADNVNDVSSTATIGENLQVSNFDQAVLNGTIEGNIIAQRGQQLNTGAHVTQNVMTENVKKVSTNGRIEKNLQISSFEEATPNGSIGGDVQAQDGKQINVGAHVAQNVATDNVKKVFTSGTIDKNLQISSFEEATSNGSIRGDAHAHNGNQLNVGAHVGQSVMTENVKKVSTNGTIEKNLEISRFEEATPNGSIGGDVHAHNGNQLNVGAHVAQNVVTDNVKKIFTSGTIDKNLQISNFEEATPNGSIGGDVYAHEGNQINVGAHVFQNVITDNVKKVSTNGRIDENLQISNFEEATPNGSIGGDVEAQDGKQINVGAHVAQNVATDNVKKVFTSGTIDKNLQISSFEEATPNGSIRGNIIAQMGQQLNVGAHVVQSVMTENVKKVSTNGKIEKNLQISSFEEATPNGSIGGDVQAQDGKQINVGAHVFQNVATDNVKKVSTNGRIDKNLQISNFEEATPNGSIGGDVYAHEGNQINVGAHVFQNVMTDNVKKVSTSGTIEKNLQISNFEEATPNGSIRGDAHAHNGNQLNVGAHVAQNVVTDNVKKVFTSGIIDKNLQISNFEQATPNGSIRGDVHAHNGNQINVGAHVFQNVITDNVKKVSTNGKIDKILQISNFEQATPNGSIGGDVHAQKGKRLDLGGQVAQSVATENVNVVAMGASVAGDVRILKAQNTIISGKTSGKVDEIESEVLTITPTGVLGAQDRHILKTKQTIIGGGIANGELHAESPMFTILPSGEVLVTAAFIDASTSFSNRGIFSTNRGQQPGTGGLYVSAPKFFDNSGLMHSGHDGTTLKLGTHYNLGTHRSTGWLNLEANYYVDVMGMLMGKYANLISGTQGIHCTTKDAVSFNQPINASWGIGLTALGIDVKKPLYSTKGINFKTTQRPLNLDATVRTHSLFLDSASSLRTHDVNIGQYGIFNARGAYHNYGDVLNPTGTTQITAASIHNPLGEQLLASVPLGKRKGRPQLRPRPHSRPTLKQHEISANHLHLNATRGNIENWGLFRGPTYLEKIATGDIVDYVTLQYKRQGKYNIPYYTPAQNIGGTGKIINGHRVGLVTQAGGKVINKASYYSTPSGADIWTSGKKGVEHHSLAQRYLKKETTKRSGFFKHKKKKITIYDTVVAQPKIMSGGKHITQSPGGGVLFQGALVVARDEDYVRANGNIKYSYLKGSTERLEKKRKFWGCSKSKAHHKTEFEVVTRLINEKNIWHVSEKGKIHGQGTHVVAPKGTFKAKRGVLFEDVPLNNSLKVSSSSISPTVCGIPIFNLQNFGKSLKNISLCQDLKGIGQSQGEINRVVSGVVGLWNKASTLANAVQQDNVVGTLLSHVGEVGISYTTTKKHANWQTSAPSRFNVGDLTFSTEENNVTLGGGTQVHIGKRLEVDAPEFILSAATMKSHSSMKTFTIGGGYNFITYTPSVNASFSKSKSKSVTHRNAVIEVQDPNGVVVFTRKMKRLALLGGNINTPKIQGYVENVEIVTLQDEHKSKSIGASIQGSASFSSGSMTNATGGFSFSQSKSHTKQVNQRSGIIARNGFDDTFKIGHLSATDTSLDPVLAKHANSTTFKELKDVSKSHHISLSLSALDLSSPEAFGKSVGKSAAVMGTGYLASKAARELGANDLVTSMVGTAATMGASAGINNIASSQEPPSPVAGYNPTQSGLNITGEFSESRNGKHTHIVAVDVNLGRMARDIQVIRRTAEKIGGTISQLRIIAPKEVQSQIDVLEKANQIMDRAGIKEEEKSKILEEVSPILIDAAIEDEKAQGKTVHKKLKVKIEDKKSVVEITTHRKSVAPPKIAYSAQIETTEEKITSLCLEPRQSLKKAQQCLEVLQCNLEMRQKSKIQGSSITDDRSLGESLRGCLQEASIGLSSKAFKDRLTYYPLNNTQEEAVDKVLQTYALLEKNGNTSQQFSEQYKGLGYNPLYYNFSGDNIMRIHLLSRIDENSSKRGGNRVVVSSIGDMPLVPARDLTMLGILPGFIGGMEAVGRGPVGTLDGQVVYINPASHEYVSREGLAFMLAPIGITKGVGAIRGVVRPPAKGLLSNDVLRAPRVGSGLKNDLVKPIINNEGKWVREFPMNAKSHGFPDIIDNYVAQANMFKLEGGATLYQLEGFYNGKVGRFEWIVQDLKVTHRMFLENGKINGKPIK